jgi:hypothetical protein
VKTRDQRLQDRAYKRLNKMITEEIIDWSDTASFGIVRGLRDYLALDTKESLDEAYIGAVTLVTAIEVLQDRA